MTNIKKHRFIIAILAVLFAFLLVFYRSQNDTALYIKKYIKYNILFMDSRTTTEERDGLPAAHNNTLYVNGVKTTDIDFDIEQSMERVYSSAKFVRLVNYNDGYQIDFPAGTSFDFSKELNHISAKGKSYEATITLERSPYLDITDEMTDGIARYAPNFPYEDGVDQYIGYYETRFLRNINWQEANDVSTTPVEVLDANGHKAYTFTSFINHVNSDVYDTYSYLFIKTEDRYYLRCLYKYNQDEISLSDMIPDLIQYFRLFDNTNKALYITDYYPIISDNWNTETAAYYEEISNSNNVTWGIYSSDIYNEGINSTIPELEKELNTHFDVILAYRHYSIGGQYNEFPMDFMLNNWENGRIVELTYQLTSNNNENIFAYSPLLDLYRGCDDEIIRSFARDAKEFGHPFLFRLCNEMNSDWTSYGGVNNMADPELFISVWRQIYNIFQEEHVDNCIWIFNPNDRNCPPTHWNDGINYYPGNEYVNMIGVTGYNNGTYYSQWAEEWREFDVIYDSIEALYSPVFEKFPWIITEFASSSYGGDKAQWIDNMFENMDNYSNIKIAVWFNSADYDSNGVAARPYWLDETPETLDAFRRGLNRDG